MCDNTGNSKCFPWNMTSILYESTIYMFTLLSISFCKDIPLISSEFKVISLNTRVYKNQTLIFQFPERTETYFLVKILGHCHQTANKQSLGLVLVVPTTSFYISTFVPWDLI